MACGGGVFCVSLFMRMSRFLSPRLETTLGFRLFSRQCFFSMGWPAGVAGTYICDLPMGRKSESISGYCTDSSGKRGKTFRAEVYVTDEYVGNGKLKQVGRTILLSWMPDSLQKSLSCGDNLCFYARVARPFSEKKLTGFDYADYLLRKGISGTALAYAGHWHRLNKKSSLGLLQQARLCQQKVVEIYRNWPLDEEVRSVVSALTIGDKSELTAELKEVYSAAGASHVLALSGLHIGILSGLLCVFLYPLTYLRHGRRLLSVCVILLLWGFAYVSGLSASVVRAVVMCSLYVLGSFFSEERFAGTHSLVLSAFLMLAYNPFYLLMSVFSCRLPQ